MSACRPCLIASGSCVVLAAYQILQAVHSLCRDYSELGQVRAQRIEELRALADQQISASVQHESGLLIDCFDWHEPHAGSCDSLTNCRRIGIIVLRPLDVSLDVARGHQPHGMAEFRQLTRPVVGGRAGLHADYAWW